jgi:D-hexose-6-phosphate mutarotase
VAAVFHPGATRTPTARFAPLRGGVGLAWPIFRCR